MTLVQYGDGIADSALIMLARLILERTRVSLPCETRAQALAIIKGLKPPPSRNTPFVFTRREGDPCCNCGMIIPDGEPCLCYGQKYAAHINCKEYEDVIAECMMVFDKR